MTPEKQLWQSVIYRAALDATYPPQKKRGKRSEAEMARIDADRWFRQAGRDFREVCNLAGMDPDFVSGAYKAGRFDRTLLKRAAE